MNNQEYILKSEVRKMIEKKIDNLYDLEDLDKSEMTSHWTEINTLQELLSELDNLSGVSGWIPVTDKYTYSEYCEYPHSNSEYEIYFGKREVYDIDDWRNMMVIKAHSYHHDDLPPHP